MSTIKAFPKMNEKQPSFQTGMDLRDWFAGLAMQGILANEQTAPDSILICKAAYQIADEMMKAREQK